MENKKNLIVKDAMEGLAEKIEVRIQEILNDKSQRIEDLKDILAVGQVATKLIVANFASRNVIHQPVRSNSFSMKEIIEYSVREDVSDNFTKGRSLILYDDWDNPRLSEDDIVSKWKLPSMTITRAIDLAWSRIPRSALGMFVEFMSQFILWLDNYQMDETYPLYFTAQFWSDNEDEFSTNYTMSHSQFYRSPTEVMEIASVDDYCRMYYSIMVVLMIYMLLTHPVASNRFTSEADIFNASILPMLSLVFLEDIGMAENAFYLFLNREQEVITASQFVLRVRYEDTCPYLSYSYPDLDNELCWTALMKTFVWTIQMLHKGVRKNGVKHDK